MKKYFGSGWAAAAVGCLVVLGGWTGAFAAWESTTGGYSDNHTTLDLTNGWTKVGARDWEAVTGGGVRVKDMANTAGFLITKYACDGDGTYIVKFANATPTQYTFQQANIVFRYSGESSFYALRVLFDNGSTYKGIYLSKDVLYSSGDKGSAETQIKGQFTSSTHEFELKIELKGSSITVYYGNETTGFTYTDPTSPHLTGKVGYAWAAGGWSSTSTVFRESSWEDATLPAQTVPTGFIAWNAGTAGFPNFTAASGAWTGTGANNWATTDASERTTWPAAGGNALFSGAPEGAAGAYKISVPGATTVGNMRFEINGYTIDSSGAGAVLTPSSGGRTVFVAAGKTATINTALGGAALTKDGTGTLNLNKTNTYTGGTTISAGTIVAGSSGALGAAAGAVTVTAAGAKLQLANGVTIANAVTVSGASGGLETATGTTGNSISGAVTLSGTSVPIATASNLTLSGVVSGTGGITKTGTGNLILSGANTFSGPIALSAGNLQISGAGNVTYSQNITGAGNLIKEGAGTLTLGGSNSGTGGYGTTTINGGNVVITSETNLGRGAVTVASGATLTFQNSSATAATFGKAVSGAGTFAKAGTGTLNLTAALATAAITVSGGTLNIGTGGALTGAVTVSPDGTLKYDGTTALTVTGSVTVNGTLDLPLRELSATAPKITATGALTLGAASKLNITGAPAPGTYSIIKGASGSGDFGNRITVDGGANSDYIYTATRGTDNSITLKIEEKGSGEAAIKNYISVDSVKYMGDVATGSGVTLYLSGLNAVREYINAASGASAKKFYVLYKPGAAATVSAAGVLDTTANGGWFDITTQISSATGNTLSVPLTVPASKNIAANGLYFFNVATYWALDGTDRPQPSVSGNKSVYILDPKKSVKKNNLEVTVLSSGFDVTADGISLTLSVTGQDDEELTPGVDYKPHVDSVAIWFTRNGATPTLTGNSLVKGAVSRAEEVMFFSLSALRSSGARIPFSAGAVKNPATDTLYFAIAPRWTGAGVDSIARPLFVTSKTATKPGLPMPNNPVKLDAVQADPRETAVTISLRATEAFNEYAAKVVVELSLSASMDDPISSRDFSIDEVQGKQYPVTNNAFVGAVRDVYYKITVFDAAGELGAEEQGSFKVGRAPPRPIESFAAEAGGGGAMDLTWDAPTAAGNDLGDLSKAKVRIYYSDSRISDGADTAGLAFSVEVDAAKGAATVTGLVLETDYWFAAVLLDVVDASKPDWTLASPTVVCMNNTGSGKVVENILRVDTAYFDYDRYTFTAKVTLKEDHIDGYTYGYSVTIGADTVLFSDGRQEFNYKREGQSFDIVTEALLDLLFDTTYKFQVYVMDGDGFVSRREVGDVKIGPFTKQKIEVPVGGSASANNGNIKLESGEGGGWFNQNPLEVTVESSFEPAPSNIEGDGFIAVGDYGYKYTVTSGMTLVMDARFKVSVRANGEIPIPYSPEDVRLYRWNDGGGYWEVVFDTKYEDGYFTGTAAGTVESDVGKTYRLMINKSSLTGELPSVTTSAYQETVDETGSVTATYTVRSNVGNYTLKMLSGPAKGGDALPETPLDIDRDGGKERRATFTIRNEVVRSSVNTGVLAFMVVNDGSVDTAVNISYRVKSGEYRGFPVDPVPKKWLPFASQVVLDDTLKATRKALETFFQEGDSFAIYDTLYRLFRWQTTRENRNDKNKWVEYNGRNDSTFYMSPTRLMWLKTSVPDKISEFNFGAATSAPLRSAFDITLPAGQWTDFVLPFGFNVCLGDVLDATSDASGASSLEIYRWTEPDNKKQKYSYVAEGLTVAAADSSLELNGSEEPFTVYNPGASAVILRIPPKPAFLSRYNAANRRAAAPGLAKAAATAQQGAGGASWHYTLRAAADGSELSSVLVGYSASERAFAVPPSFGSGSVVLVGDDGSEIGHHFGPSIAGGRTYRLRFYNDGAKRAEFTFSAKPSAGVPAGARVTFVKASTGEFLGAAGGVEQSVSVAGMSSEDVFMLVGSSGYRAKAAAVNAGARFTIGRVSVNRAARSARISYYAPASGVSKVEVSIYDIKGRQVWKSIQPTKSAAWNTIVWNSKASTGLYVARVKAIGPGGRAVGVDAKRIMFSR